VFRSENEGSSEERKYPFNYSGIKCSLIHSGIWASQHSRFLLRACGNSSFSFLLVLKPIPCLFPNLYLTATSLVNTCTTVKSLQWYHLLFSWILVSDRHMLFSHIIWGHFYSPYIYKRFELCKETFEFISV
jgi:hypothetical protein